MEIIATAAFAFAALLLMVPYVRSILHEPKRVPVRSERRSK